MNASETPTDPEMPAVATSYAAVALAESVLWRWSREFYEREATQAWAQGKVPWRITNCVRVAHAYGQLIAGWRDDLIAAGQKTPDVPIVVLELGGGSGRLAFHLAQWLEAHAVPYHLMWSDSAHSSVDAFRNRSFVQARKGVIEALHLDAVDDPLGPPLAPDVVIASYLFDSLPHDAWEAGEPLNRWRVAVELGGDPIEPECERAQLTWSKEPWPASAFVRGYAARVGSGSFLVPTGALRCLERVTAWSHGRCLVLVADKGEPDLEAVRRNGAGEPRVQRHGGGLAALVNFDAVRAWWGWRPFLESAHTDSELAFYALAQGLGREAMGSTRTAWADTLGTHSPLEELRALDALLATQQPAIALLTTLEDWAFDPDVFVRMAEPLRAQASTLGPAACAALVEAVDRAWAHHFELQGTMDVAFEMAAVLHRAGQLSHAARFYERSLQGHGRHATTCFNLALCRLDLGDREAGAALLSETLALAPEHPGATRILVSL